MSREFNDKFMVVDKCRESALKGMCDNIVLELLIKGKELHTNDIFNMTVGLLFSDEHIKALHAMVSRELIKNEYMLVCYPNIVSPYDPCNIHMDGYLYRAVPISVSKSTCGFCVD